MKTIYIALLLSALTGTLKADDLADAKTAFNLLREYQKTDDIRSVDLFSLEVSVTFILTDGTAYQTNDIPAETFFHILREGIAQKKGNNETYKNVKFVKRDSVVVLDCMVVHADSKKAEPLHLEYAKSKDDGMLRITKAVVTVPVEKLPE